MTSLDAPPSVAMTASSMMSMFTFVELLWAEFYTNFPEIKFSLTEGTSAGSRTSSGAAEHVYNRHSGWTNAQFPDGYSGPIDVFKRHFYTCFISDKVGVKNMDWFNEDMLCWESDFPHSDSNWPFAPEDIMRDDGDISTTRSSTRSPTKTQWPLIHSTPSGTSRRTTRALDICARRQPMSTSSHMLGTRPVSAIETRGHA